MFHFKCFPVNPLEENCYVLHDETMQGVIIDCGAMSPRQQQEIADYIDSMGIQLQYVLQTHMHFDHIFGLPFLHQRYGLGPWCHAMDLHTYEQASSMAESLFHRPLGIEMVAVEGFLDDGQEITFGNTTLRVIHTPGHTPGGVCFYCESAGHLFSGDTLFAGSIGRSDFPGGSFRQEIESITNRILTLPPETIVHPGHGPSTTVGDEQNNPYLF